MYAKFVDRERVEQLTERGAMLVDMRSPVEFRNGTVEGAVNLPLRNFTNTLMGLDKTTKIIMFSGSQDDSDLTAGINYATQLGFNTLFVSEYGTLTDK